MAKRMSKSGGHSVSDPRKNLASTANTDKSKTHVAESKSGKYEVSSKSVKDAKEGTGQYTAPKKYKGEAIKNKSGKMAGYKTDDGKYVRTTNPVDRKKGEAKLAYDKKLKAYEAEKRNKRNKSVATAKRKGTD